MSDASISRNTSRPQFPTPNPPLICVAGGPGMPCQYLMALVHLVPDRAVVVYDHIGCGQSMIGSASSCSSHTDPDDETSAVSFLDDTVRDLAALIETVVPLRTSFHLFGHSMGGIIAYEYIKRGIHTNGVSRYCQGLILASTPTNIKDSHQSKTRLIQEIALEIQQSGKSDQGAMKIKKDDHDDDVDDDSGSHFSVENDEQHVQRAAHLEFQRRHECRVTPMPLLLQQSLTGLHRSSGRQNVGTRSHHRSPLEQYEATPILPVEAVKDTDIVVRVDAILPALLVVRGQYDFVSEANCRAWLDMYAARGQYITLSNCSHYGFLEQEELYASVITSFLRDHDTGRE
jgi:pimeloyl-ACP methyl ester carboxylesterase